MAHTAHVAACEAVSRILRETARLGLEPRPETLLTRAALSCERIHESLIALPKVKELDRRLIALDTANTRCAEHAGARHQEPDPNDRCRVASATFSRASFTSRAPAMRCADVCGFGTVPAHLPRALPCDQHTQKMGNGFRKYPRAKASHSTAGIFSASPIPY